MKSSSFVSDPEKPLEVFFPSPLWFSGSKSSKFFYSAFPGKSNFPSRNRNIYIYVYIYVFIIFKGTKHISFLLHKKKHNSYPRSLNLLCKQISTQIGKEEHTHYAEGCCCCYFCLFFSKSMSQLRSLYIQQRTVLPPRACTLARNDRHRSCYPLYR